MMPDKFAKRVIALLERNGLHRRQLISSDNNEKRMNEVLKQQGLNIARVIKGSGSKFAGLMWMKTHTIYVKKSNTKMVDSFKTYVWKKDKAGNTLDDTEHTGSDLIDALRYSYESEIRGRKGVAFGKSMYL